LAENGPTSQGPSRHGFAVPPSRHSTYLENLLKLYYSAGACSLAPHIALREAGIPFDLVRASTKTHQLDDGTDFYSINQKGSVPVLELDSGERLTEGPAIVQYIADQVPAKNLAPANGTMPRYRLQEWLNFITSELHKTYGPMFRPTTPEEFKTISKESLMKKYAMVDGWLAGKSYCMGEQFSVADAYLFTVTSWAGYVGLDLSSLKNMRARPAVVAAMTAEGLLKAA
jgi:glutathione S-transferase